jgi:hypothetical protein
MLLYLGLLFISFKRQEFGLNFTSLLLVVKSLYEDHHHFLISTWLIPSHISFLKYCGDIKILVSSFGVMLYGIILIPYHIMVGAI